MYQRVSDEWQESFNEYSVSQQVRILKQLALWIARTEQGRTELTVYSRRMWRYVVECPDIESNVMGKGKGKEVNNLE